MNLDLKLADGQLEAIPSVLVKERRERVKLAAFNVDFEKVDERVTYVFLKKKTKNNNNKQRREKI